MGPDVGTYDGPLDGAPVQVGAHEGDPRVPFRRVREAVDVLTTLEGDVTRRFPAGDDHGITDAELAAVGELVVELVDGVTD